VDIETCGTRIVMKEVRDSIAAILERTTLASVCRKVDAARQKRSPEALTFDI
jgi:DNA-binding IscR family transcriptional regulator